MHEAVSLQLEYYLQDQSPENFRRLRKAVASSPDYAPYAEHYRGQVYPLIEAGQFEIARERLATLLPNWLLSPGIHALTSFVLHKLGQEEDALYEFGLGQAVMAGILTTGDGSEARPYLVLHTSDEYDVLAHLHKKSRRQSLAKKEERYYDCQECEDGSHLWFDITTPYQHLQHQLQATSPK